MTLILILGTAEWNQPIATNQHYAARELAVENDVLFVQSMGLRRPRLSRQDLQRIGVRLGFGGMAGHATIRSRPPRLAVLSPLSFPYHRGIARPANRQVLRRLVRAWIEETGPKLLWTYTPETYGLEELAPTIYHCVDLLGAVPGIDGRGVDRAEARLARSGATAAGSSDAVVDHLANRGFTNVVLWNNVADVEPIFAQGRSRPQRRRAAVFAGNITYTKIDFDLLHQIISSDVDLHLAGPIAHSGGQDKVSLRQLVNRGATYHGHLDVSNLAELYWRCTIGLIPYLDNSYTQGVNPLKTFEYLAAGLTVVSTPVPAVNPVAQSVVVVSELQSFGDTVRALTAVPSEQAIRHRQELASRHGWSKRGHEMRSLVKFSVSGME